MSYFKHLTSSSLALTAFLHAGMALAQDEQPSVTSDLTGSFSDVAACENILLNSDAFITDEHMEIARERFADNPEMLANEDALREWVWQQRELFGSWTQLPDLRAHPLAGSSFPIQIEVWDGRNQSDTSQQIICTLPQETFNNPWSWEFGEIRRELAEALYFRPLSELNDLFPGIAEDYTEVLELYLREVNEPQNLQIMEEVRDLFSLPPQRDRNGQIVTKLYELMGLLNDEFEPASENLFEEAQERFEELLEQGFDPEEIREFMEEAFEALEEFLQEQIDQAREDGNEELTEQLEQMQQQLQEMQEALENAAPTQQDAWDAFEMMQEAMQMQQMMNSPDFNMDFQMPSMQQMMQSLMNQLLNQQLMEELGEIIGDQSELLDDSNLSEEERQERFNQLRETLEGYADDLLERSQEARERIEGERSDLEAELDAQEQGQTEELSEGLEEALNQLESALPENNPGAADLQEEIEAARERLANPAELDNQDLRETIRDMERAIRELRRDPSLEQPNAEALDALEESLENLDRERRELNLQRSENDDALQQLQNQSDELEGLGESIEDLQERLQDPELTEEELREAIDRLGELQEEVMEHEDLDMLAIQNTIMQFIFQLYGRADEVGAKEFIKEFNESAAGNSGQAAIHDGHQYEVRDLTWEMDDIVRDLRQRAQSETYLSEEEASAIIDRLGEIQNRFDELDPPEPDDAQDSSPQGRETSPQQQQMDSNELMDRLNEMMRRNQQGEQMRGDGQESIEEMMQRFRENRERQQEIRERLEELRQQLEDQGLDPDAIDQIIEQMMESEQRLQPGQGPGGPSSVPPQGEAIDGLRQMQQQLIPIPGPGSGQGPGPGTGQGGPDGFSPNPATLEDVPSNRPDHIDPEQADQELRNLRDGIFEELEGDVSDDGRRYLEELVP